MCVGICLSLCLCAYSPNIYLFIYLSTYLFIYLSIYILFYLSIYYYMNYYY